MDASSSVPPRYAARRNLARSTASLSRNSHIPGGTGVVSLVLRREDFFPASSSVGGCGRL